MVPGSLTGGLRIRHKRFFCAVEFNHLLENLSIRRTLKIRCAACPLSALEAKRNREAFPVPANVGCQYGGTWCTNVEDYGSTAPF